PRRRRCVPALRRGGGAAARARRRGDGLRRRRAGRPYRPRPLGPRSRRALSAARRAGRARPRPRVPGSRSAPARGARGRPPLRVRMILREAFDYRFSRLDPTGAHIDPPSVAVYETLLAKGPEGRPRPLLAQSWEVSDDGLEWTLRLRPGARFHSGDRCDALAAIEALEYLRFESFP